MPSDYLQTCDPNFTPLVSRTSSSFTPRRALDPTGHLGSFYDGAYDQVLYQQTLRCNKQSIRSPSPAFCSLTSLNPEDARNLLKWYNIHDELRLSVALQLVRELGVANMINYSQPINQYTRVICYDYYSQTDYIPDAEFKSLRRHKKPMLDIRATHVTVLVNWGVCAVAILQLSSDPETTFRMDHALKNLCVSLQDGRTVLSRDDKDLLQQINHTEVFSNIPVLNKVRSVVDYHHEISRVKNDRNLHQPCNYNLCSIETFYDTSNGLGHIFRSLQQDQLDNIEDYLLSLSSCMQKSIAPTDRSLPHVKQHLNDYYREMCRRWYDVESSQKQKIERLGRFVIAMRYGQIDHKKIDEALKDDLHNKLMQDINDLHDNLSVIRDKEALIQDLSRKGLRYRDANAYGMLDGGDLQSMEQKLFEDVKIDCFIMFDDNLRKKKKVEWEKLVTEAMNECSKYPPRQIVFVDFTYCTHSLENFHQVRRAKKKVVNTSLSTVITSSQAKTVSITIPTKAVSEQLKTDDMINILLLGESGVGKSTFVNAFANYLAFETLQQAQPKPFVLMPISFLMTMGDDFEEKQVTFGVQDDLNNEDYSQPGQSVTQYCRSYLFTLRDGDNRGRKLRLIDSPGIGDVRGLAQDDINMQHIILYLSNLSHLNGVCILMKPTNARMNIFFRSCFVQLFDLFGESIRDRIMFCFTNARSTFYTPGNTGPLVKQLLKSLPVQDIPFNRTNTFCFDSESFRYLVAKQNGIEFAESEEQDYQDSWRKSSAESRRFLQHIGTKVFSTSDGSINDFFYSTSAKSQENQYEVMSLWQKCIIYGIPMLFSVPVIGFVFSFLMHPFLLALSNPTLGRSVFSNTRRSIRNAQLHIRILVRPMLETIRNILRNITLSNAGFRTTSIELDPRPIYEASAICLKCSREPHQYSNFWIMDDLLHGFPNRCRRCHCDPSDHYPVDYELNYTLHSGRRTHSNEEMNKMVNELCQTSAELAHFLLGTSEFSKNDLFLTGIEKMIKDEDDICQTKPPCPQNESLLLSLHELKKSYLTAKEKLLVQQPNTDLSKVYDKMEEVNRHPMIESQVAAAKQWYQFMVTQYEREVSI